MSNNYEYPRHFARFYDSIYFGLRDPEDKDYYLDQIRNTDGKILEAGVGTGRLFKTALIEGADIYGIDTSSAMLAELYNKTSPEEHYRISRQSIVDFQFNFKFDLVIAPFRIMSHILEKEEQLNTLNNVYHHLNPGGTFIFDAFVPDLKYIIKGFKGFVDFEDEDEYGNPVTRTVTTRPDLIRQIIETDFTLQWEENGKKKQEKWTVPLRFFFRFELEHLAERSLFETYDIYGDFHDSPLSKDAKEFVVVCRKSSS
jgi:SAM-dependent methyltransferase